MFRFWCPKLKISSNGDVKKMAKVGDWIEWQRKGQEWRTMENEMDKKSICKFSSRKYGNNPCEQKSKQWKICCFHWKLLNTQTLKNHKIRKRERKMQKHFESYEREVSRKVSIIAQKCTFIQNASKFLEVVLNNYWW